MVLEKTLESPLDSKEVKPVNTKEISPEYSLKGCWSSNTLATWCEELTHWKRPWCWERLKAGGERDDRGWDGWMASPTQWTWVWINSESWRWISRPGVLQSMGSQRVGHYWSTELNWIEYQDHSRWKAEGFEMATRRNRRVMEQVGGALKVGKGRTVTCSNRLLRNALPAEWRGLRAAGQQLPQIW